MPHAPVGPQKSALVALSLLLGAVACGRQALPDPRLAAADYANAVEKGDTEGVYALLTTDAQREHGKAGVRRLMAESKNEIVRTARGVSRDKSKVEVNAAVRFADGEQADLAFVDGEFRVGSAGALPEGARTPGEALAELRQALARRSYAGILRVLSSESKSSLENDMRSLVEGLEQPETLDVKVNGDNAEVQLPGGHSVKLKRESGVWHVEDFD